MNQNVYLLRHSTSEQGTKGSLVFQNTSTYSLASLELPWKQNKCNVSCIPSGMYECVLDDFRGIPSYKVLNVPNRTNIEIHYGNFAGDTSKGLKTDVEGCILLGDNHIRLKPEDYPVTQDAVGNSKLTMIETVRVLPAKFNLHVVDLTITN